MGYKEARAKVIEIQGRIAEINNRLCGEFDTLRIPAGREGIAKEREIAVAEWQEALNVMRSFPEYKGALK